MQGPEGQPPLALPADRKLSFNNERELAANRPNPAGVSHAKGVTELGELHCREISQTSLTTPQRQQQEFSHTEEKWPDALPWTAKDTRGPRRGEPQTLSVLCRTSCKRHRFHNSGALLPCPLCSCLNDQVSLGQARLGGFETGWCHWDHGLLQSCFMWLFTNQMLASLNFNTVHLNV